jgi:hypothetical protein
MTWKGTPYHHCFNGKPYPPDWEKMAAGSVWTCDEGPNACGRQIMLTGRFFGMPLWKWVEKDEGDSADARNGV